MNEQHQVTPCFKKMEEYKLKGNEKPLVNYNHVLKPLTFNKFEELRPAYQMIDTGPIESYSGTYRPVTLSLPVNLLSGYAGYFLISR